MSRVAILLFFVFQGAIAETKNICTNTNLVVRCEQGQILKIEEANYGYFNCENADSHRPKRNIDTNNCTSVVTEIIQKECVNQESCTLDTSIPELKKLCPDFSRSFLSVNYICEGERGTDSMDNSSKFGCGLNTCRVYCAPGCQRTCYNTYIHKCKVPCTPLGCRCREGYYRDPYNLENCIKFEYCPQKGNNTNEIYSTNGAGCQAACGSSQKSVDMCLEICEQYGTCEAGYICKEGYQRESCFLDIFKKQYNCVKTCPNYYWCT